MMYGRATPRPITDAATHSSARLSACRRNFHLCITASQAVATKQAHQVRHPSCPKMKIGWCTSSVVFSVTLLLQFTNHPHIKNIFLTHSRRSSWSCNFTTDKISTFFKLKLVKENLFIATNHFYVILFVKILKDRESQNHLSVLF